MPWVSTDEPGCLLDPEQQCNTTLILDSLAAQLPAGIFRFVANLFTLNKNNSHQTVNLELLPGDSEIATYHDRKVQGGVKNQVQRDQGEADAVDISQ